MKKRESFNTRWGFILACIGSAVGMGNIWMFPTRVSLYGGGAFLIPYFIFVALIGFTGVIGEMTFGRATRSGPIDAFGIACERKGKRKPGEALGLIPVVGSLAMAIGYTVVMGWILKYTVGAFTGATLAPADVDEFSAVFGSMASAFGNTGWQVVILLAAMGILMFGVGGGIEKVNKVLMPVFFLLFVGLAVIHKGFLLYNIYGHDTIFVTRQKAEEGPMAGIYGRYSDGYEYNIRGRLLDEFIPRGNKVLIASHKSIMYLQEDYVICNYSTISTPTIDERLFQYWTLYPDKVPEYIVWDKGSEGYIATNPEVNARLVENAELLVDDEGLLIYRLPANPY